MKDQKLVCDADVAKDTLDLYFNDQLGKEHYQRLKLTGKRGKVALIAVCNKLLKQAFAIATKKTPYQNNYNSSLT